MKRALVLAALAAGCAPTMSEMREPVDATVTRRLGLPREKIDTRALLARPLDRAAALRIAIANNARLAAVFDELGIAGGELGSAIRLGPLSVHGEMILGSETQVEVEVVQSVIGLIAAPKRRAAAHAEITSARARATGATLRLAARVDIAFTNLVAALQTLAIRRDAFAAADASATVRERVYAAGNTPRLALARERDAREQARIGLGRAEADVEIKRESLNALLGLSGDDTRWTATGELAALPAAAPSLDDLETRSVAASLDLEAGRARQVAAENRASEIRLRTFLPDLGFGVSIHEDDHGVGVGPMIALGLPVFDWRSGDRRAASAQIARAGHVLTATAVELRAAARSARISALATYQEARHITTVLLPLRQQILDETLRHYNAMNADTFTLLLARREVVDAEAMLVDALRRYLTAMAEVTALERGVMLDEQTDEPMPMTGQREQRAHH